MRTIIFFGIIWIMEAIMIYAVSQGYSYLCGMWERYDVLIFIAGIFCVAQDIKELVGK